MAFAGLWEFWRKREGSPPDAPEKIVSFTILTTEPNDVVRPLHDRMPLVIEPRDFALWLDPAMRDVRRLEPLYRPSDAAAIEVHAVSRRVNTPANDDPACIAPIPDVAAQPRDEGTGLLF
jgi:putative SOS response-associated peptidase YedK